jgi:lipid II:glycine glycyltransferase (peptidoglycan interpeptide bridge formation enzyme)
LKQNGFKYYDHGGADIDPESSKYGFTVFKLHFGGEIITYPNLILVSKLPNFIVQMLSSRL